MLGCNTDPEALTICNGYKDEGTSASRSSAASSASKVIVVIEKLSELTHLLAARRGDGGRAAHRAPLEAHHQRHRQVGVSSGDFAKFGLTVPELIHAVRS